MKRTLYARGSVALTALMFGAVDPRPQQPPVPPPSLTREFRAVYSTPIFDRGFRDWPSRPGLDPESQRAELRAMLDHAVAAGLNAVVLHVRLAGDAMYPTPHAPWSAFLSERSGQAPSPAYDPLAFAISEAHARGLQLHAWFNPFRAMLPIFKGKAAPSHVTRKHPDWIRKYGSQTWIDPGIPAARKHVLETMLDVVRRYDVDGIHIDDYFYPYRESRVVVRRVRGKRVRSRVDIQFPDATTWTRYGKGKGFNSRDDWRRANIDEFVESLYRNVKAIKPSVLVGISPFGIWRSGVPEGVTGLDAYGEIYADSRKWLAKGWLDYISPQLYWQVGGHQDRFRVLDAWWRRENVKNRYVWPALYTSKVFGGYDSWPLGEIRSQVDFLRENRTDGEASGHVHFRFGALTAQDSRLTQDLGESYRDRAIVPAFPWLGSAAPAPPVASLVVGDGPMKLSVAPGDTVRVRWWVIQTRGRDGVWTTSVRYAGEENMGAASFGTHEPDEIAVTALGVGGVASQPTVITP
jgi:uncharacterized lipoprotein YddW (UPF0748 family)